MILALAVLLGALAQSVSGFGFGLVSGPVLVATLGTAEGVRLTVLLSLLVNVAVLARHHRDASLRSAALLLLPAAAATPVLAALLDGLPQRVGRLLAGGAAVLGAGVLASGLRVQRARGTAGAMVAGVVSAAMNTVAGIGGPAVALYAENADWSPERTRSTLQVYFLGLNAVALLALGLPSLSGDRVSTVALALLTGLAVGHQVAGRVGAVAARRTTLGLAGGGGLVVLLTAIVG